MPSIYTLLKIILALHRDILLYFPRCFEFFRRRYHALQSPQEKLKGRQIMAPIRRSRRWRSGSKNSIWTFLIFFKLENTIAVISAAVSPWLDSSQAQEHGADGGGDSRQRLRRDPAVRHGLALGSSAGFRRRGAPGRPTVGRT